MNLPARRGPCRFGPMASPAAPLPSTLPTSARHPPARPRYLDWNLPDPAGLPVESIRPIRDGIRRRACALLANLGTGPAQPSPGDHTPAAEENDRPLRKPDDGG